jgi:hypothetical protein
MTMCNRCHSPATISRMSKLNTDILCPLCIDDEEALPNYEAGRTAELEAFRRGDNNFPGVGLTAEDQSFLACRRAARNRSNGGGEVAS